MLVLTANFTLPMLPAPKVLPRVQGPSCLLLPLLEMAEEDGAAGGLDLDDGVELC